MKPMSCLIVAVTALVGASAVFERAPQQAPPSTPAEMVAAYNSLADTILAVKKTEHDLVLAILAGTFHHAEGMLNAAMAKLNAGQPAASEVEAVAALVAQMGNEGDNSVAAVRKRLVEGGHHHNSAGEQQGIYDEGFVIVTREAKQALLASASAIGKMASSATSEGLKGQWERVAMTWNALAKGGK